VLKLLKKFSPQKYHSLARYITGLTDNEKLPGLQANDYIQKHLFNNPKYYDPKSLNRYEYSCYSQNGEDGIINEIFNRIGTSNKQFVEFGVQDGLESNGALLLVKGWSGLWMEGSGKYVKLINKQFSQLIKNGKLTAKKTFVNAENINDLLNGANVPEELDLLSIDIDGNDYWVWKAVNARPRVVVIEYNAMFPPDTQWVLPYEPDFIWDGSSYFGASLKSLENLGKEKGYMLVACDFTGVNAFFVREDLVEDKFLQPFSANHLWESPKYFLCRSRSGHTRNFGDFESI